MVDIGFPELLTLVQTVAIIMATMVAMVLMLDHVPSCMIAAARFGRCLAVGEAFPAPEVIRTVHRTFSLMAFLYSWRVM